MKSIFLLLSCFIIGLSSASTHGQNFEKYFELKAEKYKEAGGEYVGISPAVKDDAADEIGKFMARHPRRFRYLLSNNNSQFLGLDKYYPDVVKMNKLYIDNIEADRKFVSYFQKLSIPATSKNFKKDKYKKKELMQVAARFFFCDTVKPDKSISGHICIGLNGLQEAKFDKDYTILEAFSFEAIFDAIAAKAPARANFVENFLKYIEEVSKKERQNMPSSESYLQNVRLELFRRMESDKLLENALLEYYRKNKDNLSFEISE